MRFSTAIIRAALAQDEDAATDNTQQQIPVSAASPSPADMDGQEASAEEAELARIGVKVEQTSDDEVTFSFKFHMDKDQFAVALRDELAEEGTDAAPENLESAAERVTDVADDVAHSGPESALAGDEAILSPLSCKCHAEDAENAVQKAKKECMASAEECQAKNPMACPYHGTMYMKTALLSQLAKAGAKTTDVEFKKLPHSGTFMSVVKCVSSAKEKTAVVKAINKFLKMKGIDPESWMKVEKGDYEKGRFEIPFDIDAETLNIDAKSDEEMHATKDKNKEEGEEEKPPQEPEGPQKAVESPEPPESVPPPPPPEKPMQNHPTENEETPTVEPQIPDEPGNQTPAENAELTENKEAINKAVSEAVNEAEANQTDQHADQTQSAAKGAVPMHPKEIDDLIAEREKLDEERSTSQKTVTWITQNYDKAPTEAIKKVMEDEKSRILKRRDEIDELLKANGKKLDTAVTMYYKSLTKELKTVQKALSNAGVDAGAVSEAEITLATLPKVAGFVCGTPEAVNECDKAAALIAGLRDQVEAAKKAKIDKYQTAVDVLSAFPKTADLVVALEHAIDMHEAWNTIYGNDEYSKILMKYPEFVDENIARMDEVMAIKKAKNFKDKVSITSIDEDHAEEVIALAEEAKEVSRALVSAEAETVKRQNAAILRRYSVESSFEKLDKAFKSADEVKESFKDDMDTGKVTDVVEDGENIYRVSCDSPMTADDIASDVNDDLVTVISDSTGALPCFLLMPKFSPNAEEHLVKMLTGATYSTVDGTEGLTPHSYNICLRRAMARSPIAFSGNGTLGETKKRFASVLEEEKNRMRETKGTQNDGKTIKQIYKKKQSIDDALTKLGALKSESDQKTATAAEGLMDLLKKIKGED